MKVVLAAYSDPLAERFQDFPPGAEVSLDFKDFSSETMMMMLNFMYTTDININEDNVGELMHCALEMEARYIHTIRCNSVKYDFLLMLHIMYSAFLGLNQTIVICNKITIK